MKSALTLLALLVSLTSPVAAQDAPDYDPAILGNCMNNAESTTDHMSCIGRAAAACIKTEAGQSTIGLGYCYTSEWEQWDARLNAAYQILLVQQAEVAQDNAAYNDLIPDAVDTMREMQRNWIAYRDAACTWEHVQWGGGTGGGPASAACLMRLTGQQTIFLEEHTF